MKTRKLIKKLYEAYPKSLAEPWDHVGAMIGPVKEETKVVALCLDVDETSLNEAIAAGADMIISHHPVFFGRRAQILGENEERLRVNDLAKQHGIMAYSFHTNFDNAFPDGMNAALAEKLGMTDLHQLVSCETAVGGKLPNKMSVEEFALYAKERLGAAYGLLLPYGSKDIETVAIIGGGGSGFWRNAQLEGYDIYISGDVSHNRRRDIVNCHYNYLDLPHEIETIFVDKMTEKLLEIDQELTIVPIRHELPPKVI